VGGIRVVVCLLATGLSSVAHGDPQRTFVSVLGSDANPCSIALPCRSFTQAVAVVQSGGEVVAIDSGGFAVTIDKPVQVVGPPGVHAGIYASSGFAAVQVGIAGVVLRGLYISGPVSVPSGIQYSGSGGMLRVENVVVNGFGIGIDAWFSNGQLSVRDSIVRNSGGVGIRLAPRSRIERSAVGSTDIGVLGVIGTVSLEIIDSSITDNQIEGVRVAHSPVPPEFIGPVTVVLERTTIARNGTGISTCVADPDSGLCALCVSNATIVENATGIAYGAGTVAASRGNNTLFANASGNDFPGPIAPTGCTAK
jgi:hypothetical protein